MAGEAGRQPLLERLRSKRQRNQAGDDRPDGEAAHVGSGKRERRSNNVEDGHAALDITTRQRRAVRWGP
jgi:hypothetical protein